MTKVDTPMEHQEVKGLRISKLHGDVSLCNITGLLVPGIACSLAALKKTCWCVYLSVAWARFGSIDSVQFHPHSRQ